METADEDVPVPYYQTVPYASAEGPYSGLTDEDIGIYNTAQPHV